MEYTAPPTSARHVMFAAAISAADVQIRKRNSIRIAIIVLGSDMHVLIDLKQLGVVILAAVEARQPAAIFNITRDES